MWTIATLGQDAQLYTSSVEMDSHFSFKITLEDDLNEAKREDFKKFLLPSANLKSAELKFVSFLD